jgi:hypothetical protein
LHGRKRQKKDSTKKDGETTVGKARMQGNASEALINLLLGNPAMIS